MINAMRTQCRLLCNCGGGGFGGRFYSALYVLGRDGAKVPSVVIPDVANIAARFDAEETVKNLEARCKSPANFDPKAMADDLASLAEIEEKVAAKQAETDELKAGIAKVKEEDGGGLACDSLVAKARETRKELKELVRRKWELEEGAVVPLLSLPNLIRDDCPTTEGDRELFSFGEKRFPFAARSHVEVAGRDLEMSTGVSRTSFYLLGRLAKLELALVSEMKQRLLAAGFAPTSCPDFAREVILEGCGGGNGGEEEKLALAASNSKAATQQETHLVGGASLYSLVAFWSKNVVGNPSSALPASQFSIGRSYRRIDHVQSVVPSLLQTQQTTAVEHLTVCQTEESALEKLVKMVDVLTAFYLGLGAPFRMVAKRASDLTNAESYRVSVEMFSPHLDSFVPVGNVSLLGDYVSQRLMLKFATAAAGEEDKEGKLGDLHLVGGTAVDVTKVIACLVECAQREDGTCGDFAASLQSPKSA